MKKLDNFINCLTILANADFKMAETNDIYRTGVIGQFNLTFELAWKALKAGYREGVYSEYAKDVVRPSAEECAQNGRARSTKMRWAVKAE